MKINLQKINLKERKSKFILFFFNYKKCRDNKNYKNFPEIICSLFT